MKKAIMILSLIIVLLPLIGCKKEVTRWNFEYDYTDIREIRISYAHDFPNLETIKILDISLAEELYNDIESMDMYEKKLTGIVGPCFVIIYKDGNYDAISSFGSQKARYDVEKGEWVYNEFKLEACSKKEFESLIEKYLGEPETIEWQPIETESIDVSSFPKD